MAGDKVEVAQEREIEEHSKKGEEVQIAQHVLLHLVLLLILVSLPVGVAVWAGDICHSARASAISEILCQPAAVMSA